MGLALRIFTEYILQYRAKVLLSRLRNGILGGRHEYRCIGFYRNSVSNSVFLKKSELTKYTLSGRNRNWEFYENFKVQKDKLLFFSKSGLHQSILETFFLHFIGNFAEGYDLYWDKPHFIFFNGHFDVFVHYP